jgi:hypothetical protein
MEASVCPTVLLVDIYGLASLSSRKLPTMYGPLTTKASSLVKAGWPSPLHAHVDSRIAGYNQTTH